jgi:hypothetical protein
MSQNKDRFQVSVFRCQDDEPDERENYQNQRSVIFFLTPET